MRSYYSHLETATGVKQAVPSRLTLRSSAIFPVMHLKNISSRILFMGYWILKRNIQQIAASVTLRSQSGEVLHRHHFTITEAKTYRIELEDLLKSGDIPFENDFFGSMEIEFFSTVHLVFPFPAVVINYYGPNFSSVVHTAQRVYNDFDDMRNNSQTQVPESGFNIYADDKQEPFFGLINGPQAVEECKLSMEFYNSSHETMTHELNLGRMEPYQVRFIYPARVIDLKSFLKGKVGAGKVRFNVNWIFPRLVVGNIDHSLPAITITHTYYDCSAATSDSDYWMPSQPEWYPAALIVPLTIADNSFTNIYFYPIYSPASFTVDVEIYDRSGNLLGLKKDVLHIQSPSHDLYWIEMNALCKELKIDPQKELGARINVRTKEGKRIPARIKLGLDLGIRTQPKMPCNICTNLQPYNSKMETKPSTFRWAPILADQPESELWIMNSAPAVEYKRRADMQLTFFREEDDATLTRLVQLPPHGFTVIRPDDEDPELKAFLKGQIGWCTIVTTNPYTTTYYFDRNPSGVVGGDHGF